MFLQAKNYFKNCLKNKKNGIYTKKNTSPYRQKYWVTNEPKRKQKKWDKNAARGFLQL